MHWVENEAIDLHKHARTLVLKSTILYVLGQVLDLITTYVISPELERETNMMVARFGFGWAYVLGMAAVTSIVMFFLLRWVWDRLFQRFPDTPLGYRQFYRGIMYGADRSRRIDKRRFATGALVGILSIAAYSAIATKLLTGAWNLSVLAFGVSTDDFLPLILLKIFLSTCVGLGMFFVYPYWLQRRIHRAEPG